MRIDLHYHGIVKDLLEPRPASLELAEGATVADALALLSAQSDEASSIIRQARAFVGGQMAERSTPLTHGMTIDIMRPIAGGAPAEFPNRT